MLMLRRFAMIDLREELKRSFLGYAAFDTMSDPSQVGVKRPTTDGQVVLLEALAKELEELGLEVCFGKERVVRGVLKGNAEGESVGFMAHVDTADDVPGNGVKPVIHSKYDGKDIVLNGTVIRAEDNPDLASYVGGEIITSDGTTLLGSDDKAGVAIIMEAVRYLVAHPEIKHPDVEVYFTPDEETGAGMAEFPYDSVSSGTVYTVDGGREGEIECECFNAASIAIQIEGESIHLGSARGILVNALTIASRILTSLPQSESPESTDGRYGYYCPTSLSGTAAKADMEIIIRDFDGESFQRRIDAVEAVVKAIAMIYKGKASIKTHISYRNMVEANRSNPKAKSAVFETGKALGIDMEESIIRGGTDGARLAEKGVSCPNLYTGGHNLHSLHEWVSVDAMNSSANLVLGIIGYFAE